MPTRPFDPAWVAAAACRQDPGLPGETAALLASQAWAHLLDIGRLDAPELSRRLLAGTDGVGATETNVVAIAAVAFCESSDLRP